MRNDALQNFRKQARGEILGWMNTQSPSLSKTDLARLLGYDQMAEVSRNVGKNGLPGEAFLDRVADRIPELSWLKQRYHEIKGGLSGRTDTVTKAQRRAEVRRRINELEREATLALKQAFDHAAIT